MLSDLKFAQERTDGNNPDQPWRRNGYLEAPAWWSSLLKF